MSSQTEPESSFSDLSPFDVPVDATSLKMDYNYLALYVHFVHAVIAS